MILCAALTYRRLRRDREHSVSRCVFSSYNLPVATSHTCAMSWSRPDTIRPTTVSMVSGPHLLVHWSVAVSHRLRIEAYSMCSFTSATWFTEAISVTIAAPPLELSEA